MLNYTDNGEFLLIKGIATTNSLDLQGDQITVLPEAIKNDFNNFVKKGAPIKVDHGKNINYKNKVVGEVLQFILPEYDSAKVLNNSKNPKIKIGAVVKVTDRQAMEDIKTGKLDCFSLAWSAKKRLIDAETGEYTDYKIEIHELTLTKTPANLDAIFNIVTNEEMQNAYLKKGQALIYEGQKAIVTEVFTKNNNFFYDLLVNEKSMNKVEEKRLVKGGEGKDYNPLVMGALITDLCLDGYIEDLQFTIDAELKYKADGKDKTMSVTIDSNGFIKKKVKKMTKAITGGSPGTGIGLISSQYRMKKLTLL